MNIKTFKANISTHTTIALWVSFLTTVGLGIYSAVCPPEGVIDSSILGFGALLGGFATLAIAREAIREGLGVKYSHGDTSIEIGDYDDADVSEFQPRGNDGFGHREENGYQQ